jgi:hypothetical protein
MGRFLGLAASRGAGGGGASVMEEYTRATGITTDANNNVTQVTLGSIGYSSIVYHPTQVGIITSFTESNSGANKNYEISYDSDFNVTQIQEVV